MVCHVLTITEYRNNIKNKKGKFIEILTELNKKVVLEIPKILEEEEVFSDTYKYNLSEIINILEENLLNQSEG